MIDEKNIQNALERNSRHFHPVISFDPENDLIAPLDLSGNNQTFTSEIYCNAGLFNDFIQTEHKKHNAKFLKGGYRENRAMYSRSSLFDTKEEPRSLHLGIDIWGPAGTKIYAPLGGMVHSFHNNNNFGDYGATIILQHQLETINFYILYGHLSLKDLSSLRKGSFITRGEPFAHFGNESENGNWPPHLHFQMILDIGNWEGDYPGVCKLSEAEKYIQNSPDPAVLLNLP